MFTPSEKSLRANRPRFRVRFNCRIAFEFFLLGTYTEIEIVCDFISLQKFRRIEAEDVACGKWYRSGIISSTGWPTRNDGKFRNSFDKDRAQFWVLCPIVLFFIRYFANSRWFCFDACCKIWWVLRSNSTFALLYRMAPENSAEPSVSSRFRHNSAIFPGAA